MSSTSGRKDDRSRGLLPTSEQPQAPPTPPPPVQRRSSNPLPGISATASSLRNRRVGSATNNGKGNVNLSDLDENDFDDETPGDFDPALNVSTAKSTRTPASLLRAALTPGKSSDQAQNVTTANRIGATSNSNAARSTSSQASSSGLRQVPSPAASRFKGTPARATRYSLPVRAEKPIRTTKTSGKHVVLPSESQLAPLPSQEDEEDDEDDESDGDSESGDDDDEEDGVDAGSVAGVATKSPVRESKPFNAAVVASDGKSESPAAAAAAGVGGLKKAQLPSEPVLLGGRGVVHDYETVAQIGKPPARKPVSAPRVGPTIPTARGREVAPVAGKLVPPVSTQAGRRPAASSALARAAASSLSGVANRPIKQKPAATFRATGVRAPPLKPLRSGPVYHTFERMAPATRVMTPLPRLTAYSISSSIHLGTLLGFLRREHGVKPRLYDECAYAVYTKPLLPGFGRANVRSAPEPRSASPGAESRRERELEEREEFGYVGTYFEHRSEEGEDIDPDGYIKGGEGRGSESESRPGHRHRDSDDRHGRREGGETSAWESEAEHERAWERDGRKPQRRDSTGVTESENENEQGDDARRHLRDEALQEEERLLQHPHQPPALGSSVEGDEAMLATPLARPVAVERRDGGSDIEEAGRRPFLLERARSGSQSSASDVGDFSRSWRDGEQRRSNGSDITAVEGEVTDPDTAGARDMLMQQLSEEIDGPNVIASSYQSTDTVLSAEMNSEAEEAGNGSHEAEAIGLRRRRSDASLEGADGKPLSTIQEADIRDADRLVPLPPVSPSRLSHSPQRDDGHHRHQPHEAGGESRDVGQRGASPGHEHARKKSGRKQRKRNKFAGPNVASHNHDTSANLLTPRPILEALQSAELVILPYGVLVMYNFTAAEERSIIDDVLSSGCAREIMAEEDRETEAFHFCYDPSIAAPRIFNDFFTFRAPNHLLKLSLAHAIAQSTKLSVFEERMQNSLEVTSHIPKEMASSGELRLKRREALRLTGRLFKLRVDVNLTSNVLDTPELFWSEASLKLLYDAIRDYLEIDERVENLNERLAVANDLLEIIHEHIANAAMSKITWIVIILIVVACAVAVGEISARFVVGANRADEGKGFRAAARLLMQDRSI